MCFHSVTEIRLGKYAKSLIVLFFLSSEIKLLAVQECYLVYILTEMSGSTSMVFTRTCDATGLLALMLRNLGLRAIPISGHMTQVWPLSVLRICHSEVRFQLHMFLVNRLLLLYLACSHVLISLDRQKDSEP